MKSRIIAIDFGLARIGIAYSDESKVIAMPLQIVKAHKKNEITVKSVAETLQKHAAEHQYTIEKIIIGMPYLLSGKQGFMSDEVKEFSALLETELQVVVQLVDERLTSVQAERSLKESGMNRKKRAKVVDTVAAVIILQTYLDTPKETPD